MGNDPIVEIVAKERSELTDKIAKEIIKNFGKYNAKEYTKMVGLEDPVWDGYRLLALSPFTKDDGVVAYKNEPIPPKALKVDFVKHPAVHGYVRYASFFINTEQDTEEFSISSEFPFEVVSFYMDPVTDDAEEVAKVACGPSLELILLDKLKLTPEQQEQFRIVPYWEGPAKIDFNHFKYDEFRKLGIEGLTKAFLYANEHESNFTDCTPELSLFS